VARAAFNQRRKTIANALRGGGGQDLARAFDPIGGVVSALERASIDPKQRAERVPLESWLALAEQLRLCEQAVEQRH